MAVTLKDFYPINTWTPSQSLDRYSCGAGMWLVDQTTGKFYLNEDEDTVRFKCALLVIGSPIIHLVSLISNIFFNVFKIATGRSENVRRDLLRIALAPITWVGLELAALYGLLRPYDGRKLYATIERAQFGGSALAPCFQPSATSHLFGRSIQERNAY